MEELERAYLEGTRNGTIIRALVIINPGNPTGSCLSRETLVDIVRFCHKNRLVLLADEVYQANVYLDTPFISARHVTCELCLPVEVISFHSTSKGLIGECGHRGGYFECLNLDPFIIEQLYKLSSICLCSNVPGQIMVLLMVNPPTAGQASFDRYTCELFAIKESLARRAHLLQTAFSDMLGVTCNPAAGAMYLFPQICFPPALIRHAESLHKLPDELYALSLLDETGIVNTHLLISSM